MVDAFGESAATKLAKHFIGITKSKMHRHDCSLFRRVAHAFGEAEYAFARMMETRISGLVRKPFENCSRVYPMQQRSALAGMRALRKALCGSEGLFENARRIRPGPTHDLTFPA